jgi:tetratricopeptide (TPR) repeat protein
MGEEKMGYVCDKHKSKRAIWICADCDSLYCSECVEKRIVPQRGQKKIFYFCSKCNSEVERLSSNPLLSLMEIIDNLIHQTFHRPAKNAGNNKTKHSDNSLLSRIDTLIEDGNIDDALTVIESERDALASDINLSERYYNILKLKDNTSEMLEHGSAYLDLLAKGRSKEKLCEVYSECISKSSNFSTTFSASFKIAGSMLEAGNPQGSADVYQRFIKNNPEDPMIPKASFTAANVFNEKLLNPQKAVEILEDMLNKYPDHEMAVYARQYLGQIKRSGR